MRTLILSALALGLSTSAAFAAPSREKPADVIAFLVKQMNASELHLKGKTPEMMFDCGVDFVAKDGALRATFFHPEGSSQDVRSVFEIGAKTKIVAFDAKKAVAVVDNVYTATEDGVTTKVTYRARMEIELNNSGTLFSINLGWNRDKQDPLMYRCNMQMYRD